MNKSPISNLFSPAFVGKAALVVTLALLAAPQLWYPLGFDQGVYAACGDVIRRGGVPIQDCFETKQPGVMVMYAIPMLFTREPMAIHAFTLLWTALTAAVIGQIAGRLFGARAAWPAAVFYWLAYAGINYWSMDQAETFANLFLVVALFAVWRAGEGRGQRSEGRSQKSAAGGQRQEEGRKGSSISNLQSLISHLSSLSPFWLAVAGMCIGIAFWFKYVFALIAMALALVLLLHVRLRAHSWRLALGDGFLFGLISLGVAGLGLLYFVLNNALPALVSQFQFLLAAFPLGPPRTPLEIAGEMARFFNNGADVTGNFKATVPQWIILGGGFPVLLVLAALGAWQRLRGAPVLYAYLLAHFLAAAAVVIWQANYIQYHYTIMIPAFVLAASAVKFDLTGEGRAVKRWLSAAPAALAALVIALLAVRMLPWVGDMVENVVLLHKSPRSIYRESDVAPNVPVAEYIDAHTGPDDSIAIFGDAPWVYTLARRRNATRFSFVNLWLRKRTAVTYPLFTGQYLDGLQRNRPAYFILTKANFPWPNNDYIPDYKATGAIYNYVESHYAYEGENGPFLLFRRKS